MVNNKNHSCVKIKYACSFVLPQAYGNLYSLDESMKVGTIFKDLYRPYCPKKRYGYN